MIRITDHESWNMLHLTHNTLQEIIEYVHQILSYYNSTKGEISDLDKDNLAIVECLKRQNLTRIKATNKKKENDTHHLHT